MILSSRAEYDPHTDSIQVAIIVQDENNNSISDQVKEGIVEFTTLGSTMFSATFDRRHKVLWVDDEEDKIIDHGQFYIFLLHPPIQRNIQAKTTVTLYDGSVDSLVVPVGVYEEEDMDAWQNPTFSGRPSQAFEEEFRSK